jgi:high-affinity nickel-transport protein
MPTYRRVAASGTLVSGVGDFRHHAHFSRAEWRRLAGFYAVIALLHIAGWGLFLQYSSQQPALIGLGFVAYMLGLRHAFDADHIAAVDDTVRYMMQQGKRPLGIGFFFSLGHSTVVFTLALGIVFAAEFVRRELPAMKAMGTIVGGTVSGTFLLVIATLNLLVLMDIIRVWRGARTGRIGHAHVDELLSQRGWLQRLFGGRMQRMINHSWQMYPLGLLFGLGFDTASEVGLLAITAVASASDIPVLAVLSLPLLFAAGMTAMDTTDGVLMTKAYDWAFVNPLRKLFYNLTITSVSVLIGLLIGALQLLQVAVVVFELDGPAFDFIAGIGIGGLGYVIVGVFIIAWCGSIAVWKFGRIEARHAPPTAPHFDEHTHDAGITHTHRHFR